ncbi:MAG: NAD-dependent epimerase/dehydratase family protein, partial [Candidatus Sericytochromatia bacterium]|nr:NAD-dependent epimerase/dehydratase family protein [Candidatus Sericytochromatia bacterium]
MRAFVTGGGGFLGKAVIKQLLARGYEVISYSRSDYPELKTMSVKHILGDMNESDKLIEAMRGSDVVFHIAAKAGIWGKYDDFYNANVIGTENILNACQKLGIKKLVYTSTP